MSKDSLGEGKVIEAMHAVASSTTRATREKVCYASVAGTHVAEEESYSGLHVYGLVYETKTNKQTDIRACP